jgi:hypothetical protein
VHWVLPLSFAILLLLTVVQARRPLRGKVWTYLRCLFPSWRFFEDVEPGPMLEFRVEPGGAPPTAWQAALPAADRAGLLLNARGNLRLAYQSLVEQLLDELDGVEQEAAPQLATYRLVQRLVEERARASGSAVPGARYRFRLCSSEDVEFESGSHSF